MFVGQNGFPKSGNYLLFKILKNILIQCGIYSSYTAKFQYWISDQMSFPDENEVDHIHIDKNQQIFLKIAPVFAKRGGLIAEGGGYKISSQKELTVLNSVARLIWLHQDPKIEHFDMLGQDRKWIYIVRDGRDVVNSYFHYSVTPRMLQLHPEYQLTSIEKIYGDMDYFERIVLQWKEHVDTFLKFQNKYLLIKFENLLKYKAEQVLKIIDFLEIRQTLDVNRVIDATNIHQMRKNAPAHVREGKRRDWIHYFDQAHRQLFKSIAGEALINLGYENDTNW